MTGVCQQGHSMRPCFLPNLRGWVRTRICESCSTCIPRSALRYHCDDCNTEMCNECACGDNHAAQLNGKQHTTLEHKHGHIDLRRARTLPIPSSPCAKGQKVSLRRMSTDDIVLPLLPLDDFLADVRSSFQCTMLPPSRDRSRSEGTHVASSACLEGPPSKTHMELTSSPPCTADLGIDRSLLHNSSPNSTYSTQASSIGSEKELEDWHCEDYNQTRRCAAALAPEAEWIYFDSAGAIESPHVVEFKPIRSDGKSALSLIKIVVEGRRGIVSYGAPVLPVTDVIDSCFL